MAWLSTVFALLALPHMAHGEALMGGLYVTTEPPEAAVYVNGELRGVSPCGIGDVGIGDVEVRAEKQGYIPIRETVTIKGDVTAQLTLTLEPLRNVGSIAVLVDPAGARVSLDRVPAGRTPTVLLNVRAGTHKIEVKADGYRSLQSSVNVGPGEHVTFANRLVADQAGGGPATQADLESLGQLNLATIPRTQDLPEAMAFARIRELLDSRSYDEALKRLADGQADEQMRAYPQHLALLRRVVRQLQKTVDLAHRELAKAEGTEYVLTLRKGIQLTGTIAQVTDETVAVRSAGQESSLPLSSISAEQIARLASAQMKADDPGAHVRFALLHAAEREFEEAYEHLRAAARGGADIADARSYVDGEHLWAAATEKERRADMRARMGSPASGSEFRPAEGPVRLAWDTHRGGDVPGALRAAIGARGLEIVPLDHPFLPADAAHTHVLVIRDEGRGRPVPPYDRQELQLIMDFVRKGGGLVFFAAPRPVQAGSKQRPQPNPFDSLLQWYGIRVRADQLSLGEEVPDGYPRNHALCLPVARHPVTAGVRRVVFPLASPSLTLGNPAWALMRTPPFIGSKLAGEAAPAMVAARTMGNGCVLVMANAPILRTDPARESPFFLNDAEKLLLNGLVWAAENAAGAQTKTE